MRMIRVGAPSLSRQEVADLARSYIDCTSRPVWALERRICDSIAPAVRRRGYFTRHELHQICRWKAPRAAARALENSASFVRETTQLALATSSERLRIEVLTLLHGVKWPTASVLLHFGAADPCRKGGLRYPILDFRALESFDFEPPRPPYDFDFWWQYTEYCRGLAKRYDVDRRTLDRALWQRSKQQPTRKRQQLDG